MRALCCNWQGAAPHHASIVVPFFEPSKLALFLKPVMRALRLQPLNPPACFEPRKLASKHVSVLGSYHSSILFANGRGCAPQPPAVLSRASLLQSIGVSFFETHQAIIAFGAVFKVYDEPESRDEGACLKCLMNRNREIRGRV